MKNKFITIGSVILLFLIALYPSFQQKNPSILQKENSIFQKKNKEKEIVQKTKESQGLTKTKEIIKPIFSPNKIVYQKKEKSAGIIKNLGIIAPYLLSKILNNEPINFLILGMSGPGYIAGNLTDTILVAHINPKENKSYLISIPRDLYVKVPNQNYYTKINALYNLNGNKINLIQQKIEEITGLKINHYITVDLTAVEKIIDSLGGIKVDVQNSIYDPLFPSKNNGYETFSLSEGWQILDGKTAVKYIRTRHTPYGDYDRMKRQQQILDSIKAKMASLSLIWDFKKYYSIFETIQKHINSDLSFFQFMELANLTKRISSTETTKIVLDAIGQNSLLKEQLFQTAQGPMFVLIPKKGIENYEDIQKFLKQNLQIRN